MPRGHCTTLSLTGWAYAMIMTGAMGCGATPPKAEPAVAKANEPQAAKPQPGEQPPAQTTADPSADRQPSTSTGNAAPSNGEPSGEPPKNGDSGANATTGEHGDGESPQSLKGHDMAAAEVVAGVSLGIPRTKAIEILGKPSESEEPWEEGATGEWVSTVKWDKLGLELTMSGSSADDKEARVRGILLNEKSTAKTAKNVGVGSTLEEVIAAYGEGRDPDNAGETEHIVIGSLYYGIFVYLQDGKVSTLYMGQGAE